MQNNEFSRRNEESKALDFFNSLDNLREISSKYFQVFFNTLWNEKLSAKQKMNNIRSLMTQLESDSSIPDKEHKTNGILQIGKEEELNTMNFFDILLDKRIVLGSTVQLFSKSPQDKYLSSLNQ